MSDIATKLEYLNGTKQALKESINNLGGDITSETTFREYAEELDNIYDNLPKTTGEDTNLSLNTLKGKMNIIPKGDTQQTQYSGYNLLDINSVSVSTEKASYTKNETGYDITTNSQASSTTYGRIVITTSFIDSSKNYGVSFDITSNVAGNYTAGWIGASKTTTGNVSTNTKKHVFVTLTGITTTAFSLAFYAANASVKVENLQIFEGTTDKTYEPYVGGTASPSPTYPQNIEVVTGEQEVKVENVNLFNENWTNGIRLNATTGVEESNANSCVSDYIPVNFTTNPNYYLSGLLNTMHSTIWAYNSSKQGLHRTANETRTNLGLTSSVFVGGTAQGTGDIAYIRINMRIETGDTGSLSDLDNASVQLEKGSVATTYTPHQEQTQTISLGNIELCKIGNYQDYLYKTSGKNLFDLANVVNKQTTSSINGNKITLTPTATWARIEETINVVAGQTYTISLDFTNASGNKVKLTTFDGTTDTGGPSSSTNTSGSFIFTITPTTTELKVQIYANFSDTLTTNQVTFSNIQVEKGNSKSTYEPYGSGIWYKKENIGKYNLANITSCSHPSNWANETAFLASGLIRHGISGYGTKADLYCNRFLSAKPSEIANTTQNVIGLGDNNVIYFSITGITTSSGYTTYFQNNETILYYILATANDTEITNSSLIEQLDNLEKLKSYNGTTNISSSGSLPMILNVSAIKGES